MRFSKLVVAVSVCALGALGGGCSGSSSSDGAAPPISLDQYPQAYANAVCDTIAPCCKSANVTYEETGCKSAATDQWTQEIARSSAAHTKYDADAAGRCIAAIKKVVASCKSAVDHSTAVCNDVFVGTIAVGGACTSRDDCAAPGTCEQDPNNFDFNAPGICTAPDSGSATAHAKAGELCSSSCDDRGGDTVSCGGFAGGPTSGPASGTCYASDGVFCAFETQVCAPFGKIGDACSVQEQGCVTGAYCNDGTCAAQVDSGSCDLAPDACSSKSYCDLGQCFAKKQDHFGCTTDSECVSGVCADNGSTGQASCGVPSLATPELCSGASSSATGPQP